MRIIPNPANKDMRFCRVQIRDSIELGVHTENGIVLVRDVDPELPQSMTAMLTVRDLPDRFADLSSFDCLDADYRLLAPIRRPGKVICIGLNYRDHAIETNSPIPEQPIVFCKFPSTVIGPGDPIVLPRVSDSVDYEAELVVVMGSVAHNVSVDEAMEHVFGFSCGHDVSARDWQKGTPGGQWLLGKSFDTFAPIGPVIAHKSTLPNVQSLSITMRIGDETLQDGSTSELIFGVPQLVSHLSKVFTLEPGDLIFTGTPPGVGAARNPKRFLKPGDVCDVEIEGIGILSNPCVASDAPEAVRFRESGFAL